MPLFALVVSVAVVVVAQSAGGRKTSAPRGQCQTVDYCATYCGGDTSSFNGMGICCADCTPALNYGFLSGSGASCRNGCPALEPQTPSPTPPPTPRPTPRPTPTADAGACTNCHCVQERCRTMACSGKVAHNECASDVNGVIVMERCECGAESTSNTATASLLAPRATMIVAATLAAVGFVGRVHA